MFGYISQNRRGRPLIGREAVVNLIGSTETGKGLEIMAMPDENIYQTGRKISDKESADVNLRKDDFHGEWNYMIFPHQKIVWYFIFTSLLIFQMLWWLLLIILFISGMKRFVLKPFEEKTGISLHDVFRRVMLFIKRDAK
jgi:hypothetical protein